MKHIQVACWCLAAALVVLCGCQVRVEERKIISNIGFQTMTMVSEIADIDNIEAITELSSQILMCEITNTESVTLTDMDILDFVYRAEIRKIYLDTGGTLQAGDSILISTSEGVIQASAFQELTKHSPHAQKYGYANQTFQPNEYFTASTFNAIPIETGKQYIVYLTDDYLQSENVYAEIGREYLYECTDSTVRQGLNQTKTSLTLTDLETQIAADLAARTGRADLVGTAQYIEELGERQRNP